MSKTSSEASRLLIETHRQWVLDIGMKLGLEPTQIAKHVGLAASTLTRLVNNKDHPHALTSTTIDKIVRKLGVPPPISPEMAAFRAAVRDTIAALHQQGVLQQGTPDQVAGSVLDTADWLMENGEGDDSRFSVVVSFEAERLKRRR
jgi:hypothetical protein